MLIVENFSTPRKQEITNKHEDLTSPYSIVSLSVLQLFNLVLSYKLYTIHVSKSTTYKGYLYHLRLIFKLGYGIIVTIHKR